MDKLIHGTAASGTVRVLAAITTETIAEAMVTPAEGPSLGGSTPPRDVADRVGGTREINDRDAIVGLDT